MCCVREFRVIFSLKVKGQLGTFEKCNILAKAQAHGGFHRLVMANGAKIAIFGAYKSYAKYQNMHPFHRFTFRLRFYQFKLAEGGEMCFFFI